MTAPEFSRMVDLRQLPAEPVVLTATQQEREALSRRFDIVSIASLEARVSLEPDGQKVLGTGTLKADLVQICAISGEDLPVRIEEKLALVFVPEGPAPAADELELGEDELDEIPFEGTSFDLGEAAAQSLGLAIDPYACGPEAERVRQEQGLGDEAASGPFAALAALKKDQG